MLPSFFPPLQEGTTLPSFFPPLQEGATLPSFFPPLQEGATLPSFFPPLQEGTMLPFLLSSPPGGCNVIYLFLSSFVPLFQAFPKRAGCTKLGSTFSGWVSVFTWASETRGGTHSVACEVSFPVHSLQSGNETKMQCYSKDVCFLFLLYRPPHTG